jgi:ABC-type uncharacterized transport system ATPase subunit
MLEVHDLQVSYGAIKALDGISFGVPEDAKGGMRCAFPPYGLILKEEWLVRFS